jgi:hypothetical protein
VLDVFSVSVFINRLRTNQKNCRMKIELCLLAVKVLAGLAEVTWYLQSLPGEEKVKLFLYFNANKEDEFENYKQSRRF